MRFVIGGFLHEVNVWHALKADIEQIKKTELLYGDDILKNYRGTKTVIGGYIDASEKLGFELVPTVYASAGAYGIVTKEALNFFLEKMLDGIKAAGKIDGLLLANHGAGYSEEYHDMEGRIYEEIRRVVGRNMPIANVYDYHSNFTQPEMDNIDIVVTYDTYPHVDEYERGLEGADLLVKMVKGEIKPTKVLEKPPMLVNLQAQNTYRYPISALIDMAHEYEKTQGVLTITIAGGFPWADIEDPTLGIIVTTNNDLQLARKIANELRDFIWSHRRELLVSVTPVKEAVREAMQAKEGPYVLADIGDNTGGGSAGDGTILLKALIEMGAKNAVVATLFDPEAVAETIRAGVGNEVRLMVGGKIDKLHGPPLQVTGRVKLLSDGTFINKGPMSTGHMEDMGRTAVLDCNGVEVILVEKRTQPMDLELYRSLGIEPTEKQIIVAKSSVHYRAAHGPIAKKIIEVDVAGLTSPRLAGYPFKNLKRPVFPLDVEMLGITELKTMEEE